MNILVADSFSDEIVFDCKVTTRKRSDAKDWKEMSQINEIRSSSLIQFSMLVLDSYDKQSRHAMRIVNSFRGYVISNLKNFHRNNEHYWILRVNLFKRHQEKIAYLWRFFHIATTNAETKTFGLNLYQQKNKKKGKKLQPFNLYTRREWKRKKNLMHNLFLVNLGTIRQKNGLGLSVGQIIKISNLVVL